MRFPVPRPLAAALLLLLLGVFASACNLSELTPRSDAIRTRIAGIRAEPAELALGESTELSALLVHDAGVDTSDYGAIWVSCLEAGEATGCLSLDFESFGGSSGSSEEPADPLDLQFGVGETFTFTAAGSQVESAWAALDPEDRVEGLSVLVSVNYVQRSNEALEATLGELALASQSGDEETLDALGEELRGLVEDGLNAARRIYISEKGEANPDPIDCPATELRTNRNPSLDGLLLHLDDEGRDEGYSLGPVVFVEDDEKMVLRPVLASGSIEDYLYITTRGTTECRRETPFFAWITNAGKVRDYSYLADEGDLDEVEGRLKVATLRLDGGDNEDPLQPVTDLWLVARDRRGGLDWRHWTLVAQGAN